MSNLKDFNTKTLAGGVNSLLGQLDLITQKLAEAEEEIRDWAQVSYCKDWLVNVMRMIEREGEKKSS